MTPRRLRMAVGASLFGISIVTVALVVALGDRRWWLVAFDVALIALNAWVLRTNWRTLHAIAHPVPPTNVRIVIEDGRAIPVQCTYSGFSGGRHQWDIIPPDWLDVDYALHNRLTIVAEQVTGPAAIHLKLEREGGGA